MTFPDSSDASRRARADAQWAASVKISFALFALLLWARFMPVALAFEPFTVRDIRVEGVQRTDAGTVFNYLPIKVGDRVDDEKASAAVKALYATGFFRDVRLEAEGSVLVVIVQELPTISQIDIVGTKEFDKDTLRKALKDEDTPPEARAGIDAAMLLLRELHDVAARAVVALEKIAASK